ncbi:MAG: cell division protein FtsQ/DivIB [Spirochaetota bacterium]
MRVREYDRGADRARRVLRGVLIAGIAVMVLLLVLKLLPEARLQGVLPIRSTQIVGISLVSKGEIVQMLGPGVSGSLLLFNSGRASQSLLSDPRITEAEIVKLYPDTLRVRVREKRPAALVHAAGEDFLISADGTVLARAEERARPQWPRITLLGDRDDISTGEVLRDVVLLDLVQALDAFGERRPGFTRSLHDIRVDPGGVTAVLREGRYRAYLGTSVDVQKLERFRALVSVLRDLYGGEEELEIDLSFSYAAVREREREHAF